LTQGSETDPANGTGPGRGARLRWAVTAVLTLLLAAAVVVVVLEVTSLRPRAHQATQDDQQRSAAVAAAERFTVQFNTYDPGSLPGYQKRIKSMLTPKFGADFAQSMDKLSGTITSGKITSKGEVLASGVAEQDTDSAQVLVVADAAVRTVYDKNVARHFRWQISLVNINGKWLVDSFQSVA
jgi:Mce-associated membrane protein